MKSHKNKSKSPKVKIKDLTNKNTVKGGAGKGPKKGPDIVIDEGYGQHNLILLAE